MTLVFSANLTWYLHYILLWYVHHWNIYDIFLLYTCFIMLGQFLYRIIIVSFFLLLKVGDRRLDGFVIADGTVSCHDDNLRCHWWWQASRSFVRGAQDRALSALFMCYTQITCTFTLNCCMLFIHLFIYSFPYLFFICIFTAICFRFCAIDLLHVFYYTLILCMLLSATSTHFKWELMLYCFTLSDIK